MSNKALVDAQVAFWAMSNHGQIGKTAIETLNRRNEVFVSVLAAAEIEIKLMAGVTEWPVDAQEQLLATGFVILPIGQSTVWEMKRFQELDGVNPFTRLAFSQASEIGAAFYTMDATILNLGLEWVIDARV